MLSPRRIGVVAAVVAAGLIAAGVIVVADDEQTPPPAPQQPAPRGLDDEGDLRLIRQTPTRIVLGWTPELTGYGYLFSGDGTVVARTTDPARATATFRNIYTSYEVAAIDKGDTGTYSPLAGTLTMTVIAETANTITFGWTPQAEYGYLFSGDGDVISRTYDPDRSYAKFNKSYTDYEVAVLVKGVTGTYPSSPPVSITCDQSSTSAADFTNDLAAINNGETLCLTNAVNYGTFMGTTKNITIVSQSGSGPEDPVDNTMTIDMGSGDTGTVVIDGGRNAWNSPVGLNIPTADIVNGAANLTVKDFEIDGTGGSGRRWSLDEAPTNANILIDHFHAHDVVAGEALFFIWASTSRATGVTIQRGLFRHFSNDGVKLSNLTDTTVKNNKFIDFWADNGSDGNHTDMIQWNNGTGPSGSVVTGNWGYDGEQCFSGFDEQGKAVSSHNVAVGCWGHSITMAGDDPASTVSWNTIAASTEDSIICGSKDGKPTSLTNIYNNVVPGGVSLGGIGDPPGPTCTPTRNDHNVTAAVTYVGGADPTTFDSFSDFCLTPASAGYNGADDGGQVGVCGGDYNGTNYGPPSGEGF